MKKISFLLLFFSLAIIGCQPDSKDQPTPEDTSINFVGTWNRDSVLVNDVYPSKLKVRLDTQANFGTYTFNSDKKTGIMNLSGSDFAITWNYNATAKTITISEIDWANQLYTIEVLSATKLRITGYKDTGDGNQNERIIYLTKKS